MKQKLSCLSILLYLLISVKAIADPRQDFDRHFKLMPQPQKIELLTGKGISYNTLRSVYLKGSAVKPVLYGELKHLPYATIAGPGVLVLNLTGDKNQAGSAEAYTIEIKSTQVIINAASQAGLFYGCTTLSQLLSTVLYEAWFSWQMFR